MPELISGRRAYPMTAVTRLPGGLTPAVAQAIQKNGTDDVVLQAGGETFVASGRGLGGLRGLKPGATVTLGGKPAQVLQVDKQLNSFGEGLLAWPGLAIGGAGAAWGLIGFVQGVVTGANMAGLGLILAAGAVIAGAVINLAPALYGHFRKTDDGAVGRAGKG